MCTRLPELWGAGWGVSQEITGTHKQLVPPSLQPQPWCFPGREPEQLSRRAGTPGEGPISGSRAHCSRRVSGVVLRVCVPVVGGAALSMLRGEVAFCPLILPWDGHLGFKHVPETGPPVLSTAWDRVWISLSYL